MKSKPSCKKNCPRNKILFLTLVAFAAFCPLSRSLVYGDDQQDKSEKKIERRDEAAQKIIEYVENKMRINHEAMLKDIKNIERDTRTSEINPDQKKLVLENIRKDYSRCESSAALPQSRVLLGVALEYVEKSHDLQVVLNSKRKKLLDQSIRSENKNYSKKLDELGDRLSGASNTQSIIKKGAKWTGHGTNQGGGGFPFELTITETSGELFYGIVKITRVNTHKYIFKVAGQRVGNKFTMKSTQVLRGKNHQCEISGYVYGKRMLARMDETINTGKKKKITVRNTPNGLRKVRRRKNVKKGGDAKIVVAERIPVHAIISLTSR